MKSRKLRLKESVKNTLASILFLGIIVAGVVLVNARLEMQQKSADVFAVQTAQNQSR